MKVIRVIDDDIIKVESKDGDKDRVRLLAVDTPETGRSSESPNKSGEYAAITDLACLDRSGLRAAQFAAEQLEGRWVTLVLEIGAWDGQTFADWLSFGRLLAFVDLEGEDFNALLVEQGLARVITDPSSSRNELYLELQRRAQAAGAGLWACQQVEATAAPAATPAPAPKPDPTLAPTPAPQVRLVAHSDADARTDCHAQAHCYSHSGADSHTYS